MQTEVRKTETWRFTVTPAGGTWPATRLYWSSAGVSVQPEVITIKAERYDDGTASVLADMEGPRIKADGTVGRLRSHMHVYPGVWAWDDVVLSVLREHCPAEVIAEAEAGR